MVKAEKENLKTKLKSIVAALPEKPGTYQFYNSSGEIIYVGKAKNLKKRVSSYFRKDVDRLKTKVLVSKIEDISYFVVNTEEDALLLENQLIKKYKPRYNVLLKDGKTYPSICITKEYLPRIFSTRNINKKTGIYFGPYSHVSTMHSMLDLIKKLYKPRCCNINMTKEGIEKMKYKACLEFHIGNCKAPCIGKQSMEEYRLNIEKAKEILKGNVRKLYKEIYERMIAASELLEFEKADDLKNQYLLLESYCAKSEVVSNSINNVDVFSINDNEEENNVYINYIHVSNGAINQCFTFEYKKKLNETRDDLLLMAIQEIRNRYGSDAHEIIIPFEIEWKIKDAYFTIPQRGDKKKLLDLSIINGKQYRFDRLKQSEKLNPEQKNTRIMKELQNVLGMSRLPFHIECFDNSNISGTDAVAGCVVFKGLKPSKKEYRKFNIKTVVGPDDYASMEEIVRRRYSRIIEEGAPLPDLIITDGGIGQMNIVRKVLHELGIDIYIAGLTKDSGHRTNELLFGFPPKTISISTKSELFHTLTRIQDEVHRFAITFHRDKRSKHALHSELDNIKGIGPRSKELLIKELKSVKRIKESDFQRISEIIGAKKAKLVYNYFNKN